MSTCETVAPKSTCEGLGTTNGSTVILEYVMLGGAGEAVRVFGLGLCGCTGGCGSVAVGFYAARRVRHRRKRPLLVSELADISWTPKRPCDACRDPCGKAGRPLSP